MNTDAPARRLSRLLYLAGLVVALGSPDLLAASEPIVCDAPVLIASSPQGGAQLGWSLSLDGEWLAAGANQDNGKAGSVALYRNPHPGASPDQEIRPSDLQAGDQLGSSVSLSGDWLAAGAPGKAGGSGVVYLFQRNGTSWVQMAELSATDAAGGAHFGASVSLSGKTLVVGASGDSGSGSSSGAAYVFELQGDWKQTAKLLANDGRPFDLFGSSVAIAGDGSSLVVGAPFADDLTVFKNFGAAYVFNRAGGGWTLADQGKLTAGPFRAGNIQFGAAVAMGGGRIVVGAPGDDNQGLTDSGSAYVFERNGSDWSSHLLVPEDPRQTAQFGTAVRIDEKNRVLIGARFDGEGGASAGAAYLFEQSNVAWKQSFKIRHTSGGAFGQSVASLGDQIFLGGFQYTVNTATNAGAVATCPLGAPPSCAGSISKTDQGDIVKPGDTVTYEIDVVSALPGSTVRDDFPSGLEAAGWCRGKGCTNFVQQPLADPLPAGGDAVYLVRGQVGAGASGTLINEACVTGSLCKDACASDTDQIQTPGPGPGPGAKPFCVKTGPETAEPGGRVTYEVTVGNQGGQSARGVTLNDPDPPNLRFVSTSAPCSGGFPCNLGTIGAGQTLPPVKVTFDVTAPLDCSASGPTVTNVATVDGAECTAQTRIVAPEADLALVASPASATCGTSFSFSLTASNLGTIPAKGAVVDVTAVGALSLSAPGCNPVAGSPQPHLTCTLPDLAPGAGHSITFSAQAPACGLGCGAVTVNASVRSGLTCDRNPLNDTVTLPVPVACPPVADLAITKRHEPGVLASGQAMAYVLTVRNNGPSNVTGATVTDPLPNALLGAQCVGGNASDCTVSGNNLTITVGPLPAGSEAIYRIEGQLTSQCVSTLSNTATVSPPPGVVDPYLSNNTATDTTAVSFPPGVSIHCMGVNGALEGDFVTFTFELRNGGPNAQADNPGDEFTDTLPAGLTLITASASSGTVTTTLNTVSWNGAIPVCGTVTISVQAKVDAGTVGTTICNPGMVFFDADGNGSNESSASDSCCLTISPMCSMLSPSCSVPTLGPAGLAALALLLAGLGLLRLRRRSL